MQIVLQNLGSINLHNNQKDDQMFALVVSGQFQLSTVNP